MLLPALALSLIAGVTPEQGAQGMGLFTRVNKDGSKVYGFRLWVGKREIRKTVGPSRRPAELALAKYKNDVREKK